ncbi:MAG: hypothetical protein P8R54_34065 [Myxococcota bacterium]|nr:hypothetical protein [Myxococcota bacterium]
MRRRLPEVLAALLISLLTAGGLLLDAAAPARQQGMSLAEIFLGSGEESVMVGHGVDLLGTVWTFDRVHRMLTGQADIVDAAVFAPFGMDTGAAQGFAWLDAAIAAPLTHILGAAGGYNLWLLLMLVATQLACVALMREVGAAPVTAVAFSIVAVGNPFVFNEIILGRPTQVTLAFHALFLLMTHRMLRRGSWRAGMAAGGLLAASCFVYWFGAIAVGLTAAVAAILHLAMVPQHRREVVIAGLTLSGTALLLCVLPTWRISSAILTGDGATWVADLTRAPRTLLDLGLLTLQTRGEWLQLDHPRQLHRRLVEIQLPWTLLAVLVLAIPRDRTSAAWWLSGWFALTIPLGSAVVIGGVGLLTGLGAAELIFPPIVRCHHIERMAVAVILVGSMVGAMAVSRLRHPALVWGLSIAVGIASLTEAHQRTTGRVWVTETTQLIETLAVTQPGGLIDVPLETSNETYFRQVFHRQPLLGGPGINGPFTRPPAHVDYCNNNTLLVALEALGQGQPMGDFAAADLAVLWRDGFRTVVLHRTRMRRAPDGVGLRAAGFVKIGEDDGMVAYRLPTPPAP